MTKGFALSCVRNEMIACDAGSTGASVGNGVFQKLVSVNARYGPPRAVAGAVAVALGPDDGTFFAGGLDPDEAHGRATSTVAATATTTPTTTHCPAGREAFGAFGPFVDPPDVEGGMATGAGAAPGFFVRFAMSVYPYPRRSSIGEQAARTRSWTSSGHSRHRSEFGSMALRRRTSGSSKPPP